MAEEVSDGGGREALLGGGDDEARAEQDWEDGNGRHGDYGSDCGGGGRGECEEKR